MKPYAWRAVGGSIWRHKTSADDVPLYEAPFGDTALLRQALEALIGVVAAHGYESGTPVEAITALRERLGEET